MIEIVDAHHHLWDLGAVEYPWLNARGVRRFFGDPSPIQRNYLPADFRTDWKGLPVGQSVHVQVGAAPEATVAETEWLDTQARTTGLPTAVVAFADLTAPDLDRMLDAHADASARLRGIRQIVSRHPAEDRASGSPALLEDPEFVGGLRRLAARGLAFDLQLSAPLLPRAARVLAQVPELEVALCHAGSPWDQSAAGLHDWREGLRVLAALPNVYAKLSGFAMFDPRWTLASLEPIIGGVIDSFGPKRVMWGSNFPVDKLYRGYRETFEAVAELVPPAMHRDIFAVTSRRFYRL